ncbi:MAG: DUF5996 family protein [Candidatus Baltobacteraceae bacterium]
MNDFDAWPALPLTAWRETCDTLHMYSQIVGKIRLALAPAEPEWAQVAMYVTPRGLTTGPVPFRERSFQIDFDFVGHKLDIAASDGQIQSIALLPRSVAEFYRLLMAALRAMQIEVRLWTMPVEVSNPIRFTQDTTHASYEPESVNRFGRILVQADAAIKEHRAPFRHRHTQVQFFFGTFDLAYARFSGRPASAPGNDIITKNAMDAEEICVGFWPGDDRFPEPAFWCYAFPKLLGSEQIAVRPSSAFWSAQMGEFVLRYEDVRNSESPRDALRDFFTSTFEGYSTLAKWDEASKS